MGALVQQPPSARPIGNISATEAEERYYAMLDDSPMGA
jgi:hypothetical protein